MSFLDNRNVWKISPGKGHFQWKRGTWQSEKVISIGWEEVGRLKDFETVDELHKKTKSLRFSKPGYIAGQLWAFNRIKEGDIAVAYGNYTILDMGIVTGEYFLRMDRFVKPDYDLFGHRIPVKWLKLGPIFVDNSRLARYMARNNTIFQITDNDALRLVEEKLGKSFEFRIEEKVDRKLPKSHKPRISYEFDEDVVAKEVETLSRTLLTGKEGGETDVAEEFENFEPQVAPDSIQTIAQVRVQVIVTGSASADLEKKVTDYLEVYIPLQSSEEIAHRSNDLKAFHDFVVDIINTMVPGLGEKVVLISVEDPARDAYRYRGRTVFNFNRYLKQNSRFFWFFVAARELAYLRHNRFDYRHNNLMCALLMEAYKRGF